MSFSMMDTPEIYVGGDRKASFDAVNAGVANGKACFTVIETFGKRYMPNEYKKVVMGMKESEKVTNKALNDVCKTKGGLFQMASILGIDCEFIPPTIHQLPELETEDGDEGIEESDSINDDTEETLAFTLDDDPEPQDEGESSNANATVLLSKSPNRIIGLVGNDLITTLNSYKSLESKRKGILKYIQQYLVVKEYDENVVARAMKFLDNPKRFKALDIQQYFLVNGTLERTLSQAKILPKQSNTPPPEETTQEHDVSDDQIEPNNNNKVTFAADSKPGAPIVEV